MDKHKKRHNSRIIAVQCLYTQTMTPDLPFSIDNTLEMLSELQSLNYDKDFTVQLFEGAQRDQQLWDNYIDAHTKYGATSFLPLERAVLWVAFYELSLSPRTVSSAIIIDEALEVLQELSDQRSKALINGLLDRFAKSLETPKKSNDQ